MNTTAQLARGLRRHQAGQLAKAEREYQQVLTADPQNAEALHLLGLVAESRGNAELAGVLMVRAIAVRGPVAEYCASLARVLRSQGKLSQAEVCYRQAADVLARHLAEQPGSASGWRLLASVLQALGSPEDALDALRRATTLLPEWPEAQHDLGLALANEGRLQEAEEAYQTALRARPDFPEALCNLGNVLRRMNRAAEAVPRYRSALRKRPDFVEAKYNLGLALQALDQLPEAEHCYHEVLRQQPSLAAAHNNLGNTLQSAGAPAEALPHYREALSCEPANAEFRVNLGMAQLLLGDFENGWRNYGARHCEAPPGLDLWDGSPLEGRRILLRAEQGFGDTIQFIRYARMVKRRGGSAAFSCPPALARLLRSAQGIDRLLVETEGLSEFGCWAPLMHLPAIFQTSLANIPIRTPYLSPDPQLAQLWAEALPIPSSHLKVGIAWRGSPQHRNDRNRSIEPGDLAVLGGLPRVSFVSLQPEHHAGCEASRLPFAPLGRPLTDFADTSALLHNLDLVISVDTAVAHLAGALARPVWTLLPFAPDWRWMLGRADSPWYPTMRLFRQKQRRDWRGVLLEVRRQLESMHV
jgi:tetratricopeptide (TPR) repeat protein